MHRDVVLEAVKQDGLLLQHAAKNFGSDREVVLEAVKHNVMALEWASDDLLQDTSFATEAKSKLHVLKITLLSGRLCFVPADSRDKTREILLRCLGRLGLDRSGSEKLVHGRDVVLAIAQVQHWPGILPCGQISEYQLVR
eukprot:2001256-Amphidinium_carterae.1